MSEMWLKNVRLVSIVDEPAVAPFTITKRAGTDDGESSPENSEELKEKQSEEDNIQMEEDDVKNIIDERFEEFKSEIGDTIEKSVEAASSDSDGDSAGENGEGESSESSDSEGPTNEEIMTELNSLRSDLSDESPDYESMERDELVEALKEAESDTVNKRKGRAPYQGNNEKSFNGSPVADAVRGVSDE